MSNNQWLEEGISAPSYKQVAQGILETEHADVFRWIYTYDNKGPSI